MSNLCLNHCVDDTFYEFMTTFPILFSLWTGRSITIVCQE